MRMKALVFGLALIVALAQSPLALAQGAPSRDWATVAAIPPGEELAVELRNGRSVKGRLSSVTETRLTLSRRNRTTELDRSDVLRVYLTRGRSGASPTLIGTGIGAGVGAAAGGVITAVNEGEEDETAPAIALSALVGAGIGALTGFLIGRTRNNRTLVYESR